MKPLMKKILPFILLMLICYCAYSQHTVAKKWDADMGGLGGDDMYALGQTRDGGYILGGLSGSGIGGNKTQPCWGGGQTTG